MKKHGRGRQHQLDMAVATIQSRHGPWAVVKGKRAGVDGDSSAVPHIPTGFQALDFALGIGGLPKGRISEIVGPATSGKTTLALEFLVQAQKDQGRSGGHVLYVDQALYFDPDHAHRQGLDLSRLLVGTTPDLHEAMAMVESIAIHGGVSALVLDTLDILWTGPETTPFLAAVLNRLSPALARSGTILLVLHESAGDRSPALSALAHGAALRLQISREVWVKHRGDVRGYKAQVEVLKSKVGPAGRTAHISIEFNGTMRGHGL